MGMDFRVEVQKWVLKNYIFRSEIGSSLENCTLF